MAYQNVGTPRFYVNTIEWLDSVGATPIVSDHNRTLPVNVESGLLYLTDSGGNYYMGHNDTLNTLTDKSFIALLGHNLASVGLSFALYNVVRQGYIDTVATDVSVNCDPWAYGEPPDQVQLNSTLYDGFSMIGFNGTDEANVALYLGGGFDLGSMIFGTYYTMPHSPDLNLTLSYEYGGTKNIQTKGGSNLSNTMWTRPPSWGNLGAWEMYRSDLGGDKPAALSRSGRRTWDLSFSYLDDGDALGANQHLWGGAAWGVQTSPPYDSEDITDMSDSNLLNTDILNNDNFYSQVIHKTNGGQLPFIFQPNKDDNTNFAICKFDQSSFKFSQVANGVYNMKLKIREVW